MIKGLHISAYGMIPRINQQDAISNNLANISTTGYKKNTLFMRNLITADNALAHAQGLDRTEIAEELHTDFSQGTFDKTDNKFDLALNGPGFFRLRDDQGNMFYTRNGRFYLDNAGLVVNSDGKYLLNDKNETIEIRGGEVVIQGNGDIEVDGRRTDTIGLADFAKNDYNTLEGIGNELFRNPGGINEIMPSDATIFLQGHLEESNVDSIREMVDMIEGFRMFELGQKAFQIQDQSLQRVVNEVGVVRA